jgi:hypothetical protein
MPPAPPDAVVVDTAAPATIITAGPAQDSAVKRAPRFNFESDDPSARFECRIVEVREPPNVEAPFVPCTSATATAGAKPAFASLNFFEVRAVDAAGNADPTPAHRRFVQWDTHHPVKFSACSPVTIGTMHGARRATDCLLTHVVDGEVPCVQINSGRRAMCTFTPSSGRWLESTRHNTYALSGQTISQSGNRDGNWVVAARRGKNGHVACAEPKRHASLRDTIGRVPPGIILAGTCVVEEMLSSWNALSAEGWAPIRNYFATKVCSSNDPATNPHPDAATYVDSPSPGVFCYIGYGAALDDVNGAERDETGNYIGGRDYCHVITTGGGYAIPGSKRPAVKSYPAPPRINPHTAIVWRPYAEGLTFP